MRPTPDPTLPGPAGLFFRTENLSPIGWHQEHQARSHLERWCHSCGQSACYGFGVSLKDDGVWSCADADCRRAAEAQVAQKQGQVAQDDTQRRCPSPPAKPSNAEANLDLFGRAA